MTLEFDGRSTQTGVFYEMWDTIPITGELCRNGEIGRHKLPTKISKFYHPNGKHDGYATPTINIEISGLVFPSNGSKDSVVALLKAEDGGNRLQITTTLVNREIEIQAVAQKLQTDGSYTDDPSIDVSYYKQRDVVTYLLSYTHLQSPDLTEHKHETRKIFVKPEEKGVLISDDGRRAKNPYQDCPGGRKPHPPKRKSHWTRY